MFYQGIKSADMTDSERKRISLALFENIITTEPEFTGIKPLVFARLRLNCLPPIRHHLLEQYDFDGDELYRYAVERIRLEYEFLRDECGCL